MSKVFLHALLELINLVDQYFLELGLRYLLILLAALTFATALNLVN